VPGLQTIYRTAYNAVLGWELSPIEGLSARGFMAGRPSIVSDYVSIILRTIEKTQNDPARLRSLVYDVARLNLGKHVLTAYHQIGSAGLQQQISDLETAINRVEDIAKKQIEDFSKKEPSQEQKEAVADLKVQLLDGKVTASDHNVMTVRDSFGETIFDDDRASKPPAVVELLPTVYTPRTEILQPLGFRPPAFGSGPRRKQTDVGFGVQLLIAAVIGIAIYIAGLVGLDYTGGHFFVAEQAVSAATVPSNVAAKSPATGAEAFGFPLPRVYGVYAVSEGKLYELDPLPLKVPDPRVAISAMISIASKVTLPNGKLQFVIFRRDLVASAPTEVFVRVVARVAWEMKFNDVGPPTTTNIDGEWAIRSKSYTLRVAPLGDNPEMVTLRSSDPEFSLSPGRYVLVLAGRGYDFTIEGQVTDAAQCLERSNVVGGIVYSECGGAPRQLAN
jgi:hypothetical protein